MTHIFSPRILRAQEQGYEERKKSVSSLEEHEGVNLPPYPYHLTLTANTKRTTTELENISVGCGLTRISFNYKC